MIYHISAIDPTKYTFGKLAVLQTTDNKLDDALAKLEEEHKEIVIHEVLISRVLISRNQFADIAYSVIWSVISLRTKHKQSIDDITDLLTSLGERLEKTKDPVEIKTIKEESLALLKEIVHRLDILDEIKGRDMQ